MGKKQIIEYLICCMAGVLCALGLAYDYSSYTLKSGLSVVYVIAAAAVAFLVYKTYVHHKQSSAGKEVIWKIISFIFGIFNVFGNYMFAHDKLPFYMGVKHTAAALLLGCIYGFMFYLATYWVRYFLENRIEAKAGQGAFEKHILIIAFAGMLICWIPWVIAYYPASMENDVFRMLNTYLGVLPRDNHHPWFATCIMGIFYDLGVKLGSENLGIFIFVVVRNLLTALIFAESIRVMARNGVRRLILVITILYFAVTPVWGAYAKHAFKDYFAIALFVLFITWTVSLVIKLKENKDSIADYIKCGLAGCAASLFRNNYIYCILPAAVLLFIWILVKKKKLLRAAVMLLCVLLYFGYLLYIFNVAGVQKSESGEALSVFIQQTARTIRDRGDEITEDERKVLEEYFKYDEIANVYDPILSDRVKNRIREEWTYKMHPDYPRIWLEMGLEHPGVYFSATVGNTYGYYAFIPKWWDKAGYYNSGMTIFNDIGSSLYDISDYTFAFIEKRESFRKGLLAYANLWNDIPVLNITNMLAAYTWMIVLITRILLRRRKGAELIPVLAVLLLIGTCLASPVNGCFRYFAPAAASIPVMLSLLNKKIKGK